MTLTKKPTGIKNAMPVTHRIPLSLIPSIEIKIAKYENTRPMLINKTASILFAKIER